MSRDRPSPLRALGHVWLSAAASLGLAALAMPAGAAAQGGSAVYPPVVQAPSRRDAAQAYLAATEVPTPEDLYVELYAAVETRGLFADSKTFADAAPRRAPAAILADYRKGAPWSDAGLKAFVGANFVLPPAPPPVKAAAAAGPPPPVLDHIAALWPALTRPPLVAPAGGSALSLPAPYVVPGGRFRELYYWDSYFTMLGLVRDGRSDLARSTLDDFGALVERYGHVPNGARTYYLSRSQPPFLYLMEGLSPPRGAVANARDLAWLKREHAFWMAGERDLKPGSATLHVVAMPDGSVLNRYYDARNTPRDESYREDVALAQRTGRGPELYQNLRAAAESGWDFSSRWLSDSHDLGTIHTLDMVEPDLNALLYGLEQAIAKGCRTTGDAACAADFDRRSHARAAAMTRWLWDEGAGTYRDYDWKAGRRTLRDSAATLYPLFTGAAPTAFGPRVAAFVRARLLAPGGLRTTTVDSGQQWDEPNGWAPLQWIAVQGLRRYGQDGLATEVACRFQATVKRGYAASGKLVEKYDLETSAPGHGGEYPAQDGFGWTNGVMAALAETPCPASPSGP